MLLMSQISEHTLKNRADIVLFVSQIANLTMYSGKKKYVNPVEWPGFLQ